MFLFIMKSRSLCATIILLALVSPSSVHGDQLNVSDIYKSICCSKKSIEIESIPQFKQLIDHVAASKHDECPIEIKNLISMMGQVLEVVNGEPCSEQHVSKIAGYHNKYMAPQSPSVFSIPDPIRKFFAGYTIELNKLCRNILLKNLVVDTEKLLVPDDYTVIEDYIGKGETSNPFMNLINNIVDRILEMNLDIATENKATLDTELMYMETPNGELIMKVQSICDRRFRPIYEKLLLPPISLSNLGYKYSGWNGHKGVDPTTDNLLRRWNRIVYVCESLRDIVIVNNPENDGKVHTHTKSEARELEQKYGRQTIIEDGRAKVHYRVTNIYQLRDKINIDGDVNRIIRDLNKKARKINSQFAPKETKENGFFRNLFGKKDDPESPFFGLRGSDFDFETSLNYYF